MKRIEKPWGYEIWFAENPKYVGKILHVERGVRLSLQYHKVKDETEYILSGEIELLMGEDQQHLTSQRFIEGQSFHVPAGRLHRIIGITDADIVEVSTPEVEDVVHLEDDYGRI